MTSRGKHNLNPLLVSDRRDDVQRHMVISLLEILQRSPASPFTEIVKSVDEYIRTIKNKTIDNRAIVSRLNQLQSTSSPLRIKLVYNPIRIGLVECIILAKNSMVNSIPRDRFIREYWVKAKATTYNGEQLIVFNIPYNYEVYECEGSVFTENVIPGLNPEFVINSIADRLPQLPDPIQMLYEAHYNENLTLEPGHIPSAFNLKSKPAKFVDIFDLIGMSMGEINTVYIPFAIKRAIEMIKGRRIMRGDNKQMLVHMEHIDSLVNGGRLVFVGGNARNAIVIVARISDGLLSESFRIAKNFLYTSKIMYNSDRDEMLIGMIIPVTSTIKNNRDYAIMYADNLIKMFASLAGIDAREIEYYVVEESEKYGIPYMNFDPANNSWATTWETVETVRERHRKYNIEPKKIFDQVIYSAS